MNIAPDSNWLNQVQNAIGALGTLPGLVAAMMLLALFFFSLGSRNARLFVMAVMLWTASLGYYGLDRALIPPLEQIRANGRGITTALLMILVLPAIASSKGTRRRAIAAAAIAFFIFQCIFTFCEVIAGESGGGFGRFLFAGILYLFTFIALGVGLPRWMQTMDDFHRVVTFIGLAATIFCGATFAQTVIHPSVVQDAAGRLMGTTGNPQHCAVVLGLSITPLCYLVTRKWQTTKKRIFFGCVTALAGIFLLWTGSRTGVLMGLVGLVVMFRYRMGRALLLASFAAIFVMIFLSIYSQNEIFSQHLISSEDTRTGVWKTQWEQFLRHPLTGQTLGTENGGTFGYSENSYLATASRYGLIGLVPLFVMLGFAARSMVRLHRSRKYMGDFALAADMVIANLCSLAVGAWFEAYLLGTLTFMVYLIYIDFALTNVLIDLAEAPVPETYVGGIEGNYQTYPEFAGTY